MSIKEYKNSRNRFWLKIDYNGDVISIITNRMTKNLIDGIVPEIKIISNTSWLTSHKSSDVVYIHLPRICISYSLLDKLNDWAYNASQHVWPYLSRHIQGFFTGDEIDYYMAHSWHYDFEKSCRTLLGESEYQLKYQSYCLTSEQLSFHWNNIVKAVQECMHCFPFDFQKYKLTTIPTTQNKQDKLSWKLAEYVATQLNTTFCGITLTKDKPDMKNQPVSNKIELWRKIYSDENNIILPTNIYDVPILIIDDLYQSGATLWCYAEFLRERFNVSTVVAITLVKSMKDDDNT